MLVAVSTNLREGKGLARDYEIVRRLLEPQHRVIPSQFDETTPPHRFDLGIVLERAHPSFFDRCARLWLVPNPEWWYPQWRDQLPRFERVLCKTDDALALFRPLVGARAQLIGWESEDRHDADVRRERRFFFNPGGSTARNHGAVLDAWHSGKIDVPLTVVGHVPERPHPLVAFHRRLPDADLRREQNRHLYHLCPSSYEGWGHYAWEAYGVGALVASTIFWMPEPVTRISSRPGPGQQMATTRETTSVAVIEAVQQLLQLDETHGAELRQRARALFLDRRELFRAAFTELANPVMRTAC